MTTIEERARAVAVQEVQRKANKLQRLLTHLRDPASVVHGWAANALPGARLVVN